jgi:hypothetical protein
MMRKLQLFDEIYFRPKKDNFAYLDPADVEWIEEAVVQDHRVMRIVTRAGSTRSFVRNDAFLNEVISRPYAPPAEAADV